MRIHKFTTHLRPEDAYAIIALLDQLRELLMLSYGDDIRAMLQEATRSQRVRNDGEGEPF